MPLPAPPRGVQFVSLPDPAAPVISTLSLHDALPICPGDACRAATPAAPPQAGPSTSAVTVPADVEGTACGGAAGVADRKSTRLNSSHGYISYAVFCLKKKKKKTYNKHNLLQ